MTGVVELHGFRLFEVLPLENQTTSENRTSLPPPALVLFMLPPLTSFDLPSDPPAHSLLQAWSNLLCS